MICNWPFYIFCRHDSKFQTFSARPAKHSLCCAWDFYECSIRYKSWPQSSDIKVTQFSETLTQPYLVYFLFILTKSKYDSLLDLILCFFAIDFKGNAVTVSLKTQLEYAAEYGDSTCCKARYKKCKNVVARFAKELEDQETSQGRM